MCSCSGTLWWSCTRRSCPPYTKCDTRPCFINEYGSLILMRDNLWDGHALGNRWTVARLRIQLQWFQWMVRITIRVCLRRKWSHWRQTFWLWRRDSWRFLTFRSTMLQGGYNFTDRSTVQHESNVSSRCHLSNMLANLSLQEHEELTGKDASWILTTAVIIFTMQTGRSLTVVSRPPLFVLLYFYKSSLRITVKDELNLSSRECVC